MKRLYQFSIPQAEFQSKSLNFAEVDGGFEAEMMLFSTAFNRNKAYFQVSDLMKWANKLDSIMFNFNHDLNLSSGKYLGNQNKFTAIRPDYSTGELEIFATFRTTDPMVVARKSEITAPSVELMVDDENCISSENGEYFTAFDWVGCALLLGVIAGSGNARVGQIKDFNILQQFNITNDMTKEEMNELLTAQKTELLATFEAKIGDIVSRTKDQSACTSTYTDEKGNKYETNSMSMWESITTLIESGQVTGALSVLMNAKKLEVKEFGSEENEQETPPPPELPAEPTAEELEDAAVLADVQMKLQNVEKRAAIMSNFKAEKLVSDRESDAPNAVTSPEYKTKSSFISNLI